MGFLLDRFGHHRQADALLPYAAKAKHYLAAQGAKITRARAEEFMLSKLTRSLTDDFAPLLPAGITDEASDALAAFTKVWFELIACIEGAPGGAPTP